MNRGLLALVLFLCACGAATTPDGGGGGTGGGAAGGTGGGAAGGTGGGTGGGAGGGSGSDGGTACATTYASGCANPTNLTASASPVTFNWTSVFGAPKCIRIKAGSTVLFTGVGSVHPIEQDCGPVIFFTGNKTAPLTQTFVAQGMYGFHCPAHGASDGSGMGLAVEVVP